MGGKLFFACENIRSDQLCSNCVTAHVHALLETALAHICHILTSVHPDLIKADLPLSERYISSFAP